MKTFLMLGCVAVVVLTAVAGCRERSAGHGKSAFPDSAAAGLGGLVIDYPLDETVFPPEIAAPTLRWTDSSGRADAWRVTVEFVGDAEMLTFLADGAEWTPTGAEWAEIKGRSLENPARLTVCGLDTGASDEAVSGAAIVFRTSRDEVGAPIFYREVNLPFIEAVKDPTRIRWRFGSIDSEERPPIVLENLPVCGNCHSFSADGSTLGMDVDYANDKGSYALTETGEEIVLTPDRIITWSDYRRGDGQHTFGLLSQVSPDGKYVISTVKDRSVFVARADLAFSQLFFPIKGILVVYNRETGEYRPLPGADDPRYVQSNATWSPDGRHVVFARSRVYDLKTVRDKGKVLLAPSECEGFLEGGETFTFDLYRVPFNEGRGGLAEPIKGASGNGLSNYFARYSPDGKWIVFCKSRSFMLLQPDSELYIIPAAGGEARRLHCNTPLMNSWHSWSPNGRWLVFSSKANTPYTQLFLTHIDAEGESSPAVLLSRFTGADRAANIPEFVNLEPGAIKHIRELFLDDVSYVRAGDTFMRADDVESAMREYRKALELNAENAIAHCNLGGLLAAHGSEEEGAGHLAEALRLDPENSSTHYNLGMLLYRHGALDEAVGHLSAAVRIKPELFDAQAMLGSLLCARGQFGEGAACFGEALRHDPDNAAANYGLGELLARQGRVDEAGAHLARALEAQPDHSGAHYALGKLLLGQGQHEAAIEQLGLAVRDEPDSALMHRELAWILVSTPDARLRDAPRAIELARRACELTGQQRIEPLDVLGVCYAAAGRFDEALAAARQALSLAEVAGNEQIADIIRRRVAAYERGEGYEAPGAR